MLKEALASAEFAVWPQVSLVLFAVIMVGVYVWIMRPGSRRIYEQISQLALDEQEKRP